MSKNKGGRPPKYKTPEEMQKIIDDYFNTDAWIEINDKPKFAPTVEGLAYALDLSRMGLIEYGNKDEFSYTIKRAKQKVSIALEQNLWGNAVTGTIFNLKNNFGWKDKTEVEATHNLRELKDYTTDELIAMRSK